MKFKIIVLACMAASLTLSAKSHKRGVGENQFRLETQMSILEPGVEWFYTWGGTPDKGYQDQVINFQGMEFVPMCWNAAYNADAIRNYCAEHPAVKYILGFNEPNFKKQADMTPQAAAAEWPAVQALAAELGLEIVAPALNYSPDAPYQDPTKWMDEFVALVGNDAFDYLAIHNYGGLGVMKSFATTFHEKYGKPVWVTEFCNWPNGAGKVYVSPYAQIASMITSVEWLEKTDWIYRYAWFKPVGPTDAADEANYGLIINENGMGPRTLSEQGYVYTYMTDFDPDVFHAVGELVPASEYIASSGIMLGKGADPACPRPIEVSKFSAGATLDYQFDVESDGQYVLELTVSGVGEPTRFDPSIAIVEVNADGEDGPTLAEARNFTLPGSDDSYRKEYFTVDLKAGRQTIRLKDAAPFTPSGIRISSLMLADPTGIESVAVGNAATAVDVYSPSGIRVRAAADPAAPVAGLPAGIYVAGGKKFIVR